MRHGMLVLLVLSGCASFTEVERGDWVRVWADSANRKPDDPQTIVTRDAYEEDIVTGNNRLWEGPPGWGAPLLHETDKVGLKVGEVLEFRVDERAGVELLSQGNAVKLHWNPMKKVDGWKDGNDVTERVSRLFVVGKAEGTAVLRLVSGSDPPHDVPVTVTKK